VEQALQFIIGVQHRHCIRAINSECSIGRPFDLRYKHLTSNDMELKMADTNAENLAWLIKTGQIKDGKAPTPTTSKDEE